MLEYITKLWLDIVSSDYLNMLDGLGESDRDLKAIRRFIKVAEKYKGSVTGSWELDIFVGELENAQQAISRTATNMLLEERSVGLIPVSSAQKLRERANDLLYAAREAQKVARIFENKDPMKRKIAFEYGQFLSEPGIPIQFGRFVAKGTITKEGFKDLPTGTIEVSAGAYLSHDVRETIFHELGHSVDEVIRERETQSRFKGRVYTPIAADESRLYNQKFFNLYKYDKLFELTKQIAERERQRLARLQYKNQEMIEKSVAYKSKSTEIFARNFAEYLLTGKTTNPELEEMFRNIKLSPAEVALVGEIFNLETSPIERYSEAWKKYTSESYIGEERLIWNPAQLGGIGGGGTVPPDVNIPTGNLDDFMRRRIRELLEQRLGEVFRSLSPEQIEKAIDDIIAGKGASGMRLGGERFRTTRIRQEAEKFAKEQMDNIAQQISQGAQEGVRKPGEPVRPATDREVDERVARFKREIEEELRAQKPPDRPSELVSDYSAKLGVEGIKPNVAKVATEEFKKQIEEAALLNNQLDKVKVTVSELSTGFSRITTSLSAFGTEVKNNRRWVGELNGEVKVFSSRQEYSQALKTEGRALSFGQAGGETYRNLTLRGLDETTSKRFVASFKESFQDLQRLGAAVTSVQTKITPLSNGILAVSASFKEGNQTLRTHTQYLEQTATGYRALTQEQFKLKQQQRVTPVQAASYEKQFPRAFAVAREKGFEPLELKRAPTTEATTGLTQFSFAAKDANGAVQTLHLTMDRWGRVIGDTQKRFRSFGDSLVRNTAEVLKWSVAVTLIYGPLRKVQELVSTAIDNEAKLADITVAVGRAQRDTTAIFEDAARAAQLTGESINGVLEGYSLAYRAAGALEDPIQRTTVANQLLVDSLVLSKLSSLDQAEALDILAGSLRQVSSQLSASENSLLQGVTLLDKWVAVSNKANVDLATLATAFSITSESAENAGVNLDQLNGIVGALSEKIGGLGGRETGNAVRALIGGVYTESAARALQQYGIAVNDTSGKMRDFLDIMEEISTLNQQGLISDDQLNKLALTLGGGVRRGQQYLAFLTDLQRVNEIAAVSAGANGDAQEALSIKLETVQSSITRLGNAFQQLAQTLGTKGGILDVFKTITDTATTLVGALDDVLALLGKAGPTLITAGIAFGTFFRGAPGRYTQGIAGGVASLGNLFGSREGMSITNEGIDRQRIGRGDAFVNSAIGGGLVKGIGGILPALPSAIGAIGQGDYESAGASIGGAIVGTIIAGGNPIGGILGSAIADALLNNIRDAKGELDDLFPKGDEIVPDDVKGDLSLLSKGISFDESTRAVLEGYAKQFGGGTTQGAVGSLQTNFLNKIFGLPIAPTTSSFDFSKVIAEGILKTPTAYSPEEVNAAQRFVDLIDEYFTRNVPINPEDVTYEGSRAESRVVNFGLKYGAEIDALSKEFLAGLRGELTTGDISGRQYTEQAKITTGFTAAVPQYFVAMTTEEERALLTTQQLNEEFQKLATVLTKGGAEQISYFTQLNAEIQNLEASLETAIKTGQDVKIGDQFFSVDALEKRIGEIKGIYRDGFNEIYKETQRQQITLPSTVDFSGITLGQFQGAGVEDAAKNSLAKYIAALEETSPREAEVAALQAEKEDLLLKFSDTYFRLAGIPAEFLQDIIKEFQEQGKLSIQQGLGFQTFDVSNAVLQQVAAQSIQMANQWKTLYGYAPDIQEQITISKEGIIDPMKADWKIVQYLLSQIADNTEKTVDGIFNLPEGASFWFPSGLIQYLQGGGGGGGGGLPDISGGAPTEIVKEDLAKERIRAREELLHRTPTQEPPQQSMLDLLKDRGIFTPVGQQADYSKDMWTKIFGGTLPEAQLPFQDLLKNFGVFTGGFQPPAPPPETARIEEQKPVAFRLELESRTQLVVDGRVLADVIKPYLTEDLVAGDGTQGSTTQRVVI